MFSCDKCSRRFQYKNSVNRHYQREHINKKSRRKLKCPNCNYECRFYHDLRLHMNEDHDINCEDCVQRIFKNFREFEVWKKTYEEKTHFIYVKHSSPKIFHSANEKKTYFVCHRTGNFQSGSCGQRKLKSQGSNKINASCPSTMEVVESLIDGSVAFILWHTHVGHDAEVSRTFLSKDDKKWLVDRIEEGDSHQQILDDIHQISSKNSRMAYIKSQDIRNLRKHLINSRNRNISSKIESCIMNIEKSDVDTCHSFIDFKNRGYSEDQSFFQEEDVMLILITAFQKAAFRNLGDSKVLSIDVTPNIEDYDYRLLILNALSDLHTWFPFAYCITNTLDYSSIEYFLKRVKEKLGSIHCFVLLCDDNYKLYDIWCQVMPSPQHHFLHQWYVKKQWSDIMCRMEISDSAKSTLYNLMITLLTELNELCFVERCNKLMNILKLDNRYEYFRTIFISEYLNRFILWAGYQRNKIGYDVNCEKKLKSFYLKLCEYFKSKLLKHDMNGCLSSLIALGHNCEPIYKHMINVITTYDEDKKRRIFESHRQSIFIRRNQIMERSLSKMVEYMVTDKNECTNTVQYLGIREQSCGCSLQCELCKICIHNFTCTCIDYALNLNICKHIHACAIIKHNIVVDVLSDVNTDIKLDDFIEECEEEIEIINHINVDLEVDEENDNLVDGKPYNLLQLNNTEMACGETQLDSITDDILEYSDIESVGYENLFEQDEQIDSHSSISIDEEVSFSRNISPPPLLYYNSYSFDMPEIIDTLNNYSFDEMPESLQLISTTKHNEFKDVIHKGEDCSSFNDDPSTDYSCSTSMDFREEVNSVYQILDNRFDNDVIKNKTDDLFLLTNIVGADNEINRYVSETVNEQNSEICFAQYDSSEKTILGL